MFVLLPTRLESSDQAGTQLLKEAPSKQTWPTQGGRMMSDLLRTESYTKMLVWFGEEQQNRRKTLQHKYAFSELISNPDEEASGWRWAVSPKIYITVFFKMISESLFLYF